MSGAVMFAAVGPLGHDAAELRERADALLSRPPFADGAPGPVRRLLRLVGDRVAAFLDAVLGETAALGLLPWIVVVLGTALLGWLVWRITRGLSAGGAVVEVPAESVTRGAEDWHADADAAEARGELRDALRFRYAAMVSTLLGAGTLEHVPGRTVRELDAEVAEALPTVAEVVAAAGRRFEDAVYGHREVTGGDLAVVAAAASGVRGAVARPRVERIS